MPAEAPNSSAVLTEGLAEVRPEVRLLGSPCLYWPSGRSHALERHDAALLALLAQDGATPRARLAAWLWPDLDAKRARGSLRQRLFRLRRIAGVEIVGGDEVVRLDPALQVDLFDVEAALADDIDARRGELLGTHAHDDNEALDAWIRTARARWRGSDAGRVHDGRGPVERRTRVDGSCRRLEAVGHKAPAGRGIRSGAGDLP